MKKGGGKQKGSQYERDIGYKLSLWLSHGERKDVLCRTVGSGAQFTFSKSVRGIPGDLRSQHELGDLFCQKFVLECKFWKDLELIRFLSAEGELYKAFLKVKTEAVQLNKGFMLIAKQNHKPDLLFVSKLSFFIPNEHSLFGGECYMFFLDNFLTVTTPEILLNGTQNIHNKME